MGHNYCRKCGLNSSSPGSGFVVVKHPNRKWWQFWRYKEVVCDACGGDGYAKPSGWPDEAEMKRLRPKPPKSPPPPPPKPLGYAQLGIRPPHLPDPRRGGDFKEVRQEIDQLWEEIAELKLLYQGGHDDRPTV